MHGVFQSPEPRDSTHTFILVRQALSPLNHNPVPYVHSGNEIDSTWIKMENVMGSERKKQAEGKGQVLAW